MTAECELDLQAGSGTVAVWSHMFRFRKGPTKSVVMVLGPGRNVPACHVTLGGHGLPVVLVYKYRKVTITLPSRVPLHAQHLVNRGTRLFAQCVFVVQFRASYLTLASSIFMTYVLSSVSWGSCFPSALRLLDRALRK